MSGFEFGLRLGAQVIDFEVSHRGIIGKYESAGSFDPHGGWRHLPAWV